MRPALWSTLLILSAGAAMADCEALSERVEFCATPTIWGLETPDVDFAEGKGLSYPAATPSLFIAPFDFGPLLPPLDGDPEAVFEQLDLVLGYANPEGGEVFLRDRFMGPDVPAYTVGLRDAQEGRTSLQSIYELGGTTWFVLTAVPWLEEDPGHMLAHGQALRALALIESDASADATARTAAESCAPLTPPLRYCAPVADGALDVPDAPFVNFDGSEQWNLSVGDVFDGYGVTVIVYPEPAGDTMAWSDRLMSVFEQTGSGDIRALPETEATAELRDTLRGLGFDGITQVTHVEPYDTFQKYEVLSLIEGAFRVRVSTSVTGPLTTPPGFQVPGIGMLRPEADEVLRLHRKALDGIRFACSDAETCAAAIRPLRDRAREP